MLRFYVSFVGLGVCLCTLRAEDSPQFRGPLGSGVSADSRIPSEWSADSHVAWKVKVPGSGWSQPIVLGDRLYVTSAVSDKPLKPKDFAEGVKDPQSRPDAKPTVPDILIEWQVHCFDAKTGKPLWSRTAAQGKPKHPIHPSNTYASETPAADSNGIYAFFGATGDLAAYDHAGKLLWKKDLGAFPTTLGLGTGSSPTLADGRLFVQHFTEEQAFLVCFDARTGKELWRAARDKPGTSWTTPFVWRNRLRQEVVVFGPDLITSHDPQTGAELWRAVGLEPSTTSSPTADEERLYFGSSKPGSPGPVCAVKAGAKGTVSPKPDEAGNEYLAWLVKNAGPNMPSPVASGGFLYVPTQGFLTCFDTRTGEVKYKERLPDFRVVAASPVIAGDRLLLLDEGGVGLVIKAGATFEQLGKAKLDDTFWTTPTVAGNAVYLRGIEYLYCVRE